MLTRVMESDISSIVIHNVIRGGVDSRLRKVYSTKATKNLVHVLLDSVPGSLARKEVRQEGISIISPSIRFLTCKGIIRVCCVGEVNWCLNELFCGASGVCPVVSVAVIIPRTVGWPILRPRNIILCINCHKER